jgi:Ubiquitin-activating enzyme E1 FCCH domain
MTTGIVIKGRRTTFAVGTSTGTAIAITSISNATEALVTTTAAHGLTDQAVVLFAGVGGMTELNGLILPIDVISTTTFKIIKYNTLNAPTYTTGGTAAPYVFTNHCELTGLTSTTGSTPEQDDSTWCDDIVKIGFGKADPGSFTVNYNYADTLVTQTLEASRDAATLMVMKIGFLDYPFKRFEIGTVTQTSAGISDANNGKWEGTAQIRRRFNPVNVNITP